MTKKTVISLILMSLAVGIAAAQDTLRLTLDSCLSYAYGHSPTVLSADLQRQSAVAALEQARMNFTPSLAASASTDVALFQGTRTTNTSYGAGASWTLFDGVPARQRSNSKVLTPWQAKANGKLVETSVSA